ncbi:unnamed protein product, partial [Staurois parvus]
MPPISVPQQCYPSMPISCAHQYSSVPPVRAISQHCPSVLPINAHQCHLSVTIISTYQCSIISASSSMPTSAASSV